MVLGREQVVPYGIRGESIRAVAHKHTDTRAVGVVLATVRDLLLQECSLSRSSLKAPIFYFFIFFAGVPRSAASPHDF